MQGTQHPQEKTCCWPVYGILSLAAFCNLQLAVSLHRRVYKTPLRDTADTFVTFAMHSAKHNSTTTTLCKHFFCMLSCFCNKTTQCLFSSISAALLLSLTKLCYSFGSSPWSQIFPLLFPRQNRIVQVTHLCFRR